MKTPFFRLNVPYSVLCTIEILCFVVLTLSFSVGAVRYNTPDAVFTVAAEQSVSKIVIIDPGHGGEDSGAIGADGALEKDLNLAVAKEIGELLYQQGYTVFYTRTEDKLLYREEENVAGLRKISDLKNRCLVAQTYPNAIFVSIHMNAFGDARYSGLQVYYGTENESSSQLASCIQSEVQNREQPDNTRKIKKGTDIYIMEHIESPCVLVECGFLSNPEECQKLSEKEYQKRLSFAIVCGIIRYEEENISK